MLLGYIFAPWIFGDVGWPDFIPVSEISRKWPLINWRQSADTSHAPDFLYGVVRFTAILLKFNWMLTCYEFGIDHEFATLNIQRGKRDTPRDEI